jgi:glycosyltransferase involved in cell wall biosynthesis
MPKVSIIIPVYNKENYLKKCLDSVCNQTLQDIEIICINDCSEDKSLSILNDYSGKDDRIRIIDFQENKGVSAARNAGIKAANGEFVAFVDSDDYIDLNFYEELYSKAEYSNLDSAKASIVTVNENNIETPKCSSIELYDFVEKDKAYFYCTFTTAIFKRSVILNSKVLFPENIKHFEDPYFLIKLVPHLNSVGVVDSVNYYYSQNSSSQTKQILDSKVIDDILYASLSILDYFKEIAVDKQHYKIVFCYLFNELNSLANSNRLSEDLQKQALLSLDSIKLSANYLDECLEFINNHRVEVLKKKAVLALRSKIKNRG